MKTSKKFSLLVFFVCLAVCSLIFAGCLNYRGYDEAKCKQRFEKRFSLQLPSDAKLSYYDSCSSRDGTDEYYVWQFEEEPTQILNQDERYTKRYSTDTEEEVEQIKQYFKKAVKRNIEGIFSKTPYKYGPDWDCDYLVAWRNFKSYSTETEIRLGPSYFYDIEQKLLIGWCSAITGA